MAKSGDPRLGDLISKTCTKNVTSQIGIIGYPCDEGVARNQGRIGSKLGPESFRKYLPKIGTIQNPEFNIDLNCLNVKDLGDVLLKETLEDTHVNLKSKVLQVLKDGFLPVIIGGGNDQSYPCARALMDHLKTGDLAVVNIDAHLDVRPLLENGRAHSGSPCRQLLDDQEFGKSFVEFASHGSVCSNEHAQYVVSKGGRILWLSMLRQQNTNPVAKFVEVLNSFGDKPIFLSFDLHFMKSSDCPGVSAPRVVGLTSEEALDICREAGKRRNVKMLAISELNPKIEEDRTARLVVNMFYYFLLGVAERK